MYVVDSGRGTAGASQPGRSTNGRVWKMVLDSEDPTKVTSFSVHVEGDDTPVKTLGEVHQPDNIESTPTGLLLTEDPGIEPAVPGRLDRPERDDGTTLVGSVSPALRRSSSRSTNPQTEGQPMSTDAPAGNWGAWETSGIVDASAAFGPGAFLIDVQASTLWVEKAPGDDNNGDGQPDFTYKRAGGQLLLLRIPGL